jgi:geranylgeranyl diphosphate synthase type I
VQPPAALARYGRQIEDDLRALLGRADPPVLYAMLRYHLGWEDARGRPADHVGKRLRPALCLLACEATGGDPECALPTASAVEFVHNFSLIHDDVQDEDRLRHGRETVWAVWGRGQAINAGDALLALAHVSLAGLAERGIPPDAVVEASRLLNERTLEMVEGQVMDIAFEERLDVRPDEYVAMISRKTGALFDASLALGAIAAGAPPPTVAALGRCGRKLGIAFQVRDDMLGAWGAESRTGKPVAADIRRRKKTLPVVYAFENAAGDELERLQVVYGGGRPSDEDVSIVLRLLKSVGAQEHCEGEAAAHLRAALAELDAAGVSGDEIREVAEFLLRRDY